MPLYHVWVQERVYKETRHPVEAISKDDAIDIVNDNWSLLRDGEYEVVDMGAELEKEENDQVHRLS